MLDAQTIATVKSTIPLLVATGPKLTAHFYDRMFAHNPELKEIFLRQQSGESGRSAARRGKNRAKTHQFSDQT